MPDLLIPDSLQNTWQERVAPVLVALGVPKETQLFEAIGSLQEARLWAMEITPPRFGGIISTTRVGDSWRYGEMLVDLEGAPSAYYESSDATCVNARVSSAFGIRVYAKATNALADRNPKADEINLLVISTDLVTLLAGVLPGKDAFVVTEIWANTHLPVWILQRQDLSFKTELRLGNLRYLGADVFLAVDCPSCNGAGSVICSECGGDGEGDVCPKCGGTGDFIGKNGARVGVCFGCSGSGRLPCWKCRGTGSQACGKCQGRQFLTVCLYPGTGLYGFFGETFCAEKVSASDASGNAYSLSQGAAGLLATLSAAVKLAEKQQRQLEAMQVQMAEIDPCLDRAMEAQGLTEAVVNFRLLLVGNPAASLGRVKNRVVMAFRILKPPAWVKSGNCPLPPGTALSFWDCVSKEKIQIGLTFERATAQTPTALLHSFGYVDNLPYVHISLPREINLETIPDPVLIKIDQPPPAELAQKRELARWCSPSRYPELLKSIAIPQPPSKRPANVRTSNALINESQREALDWMMSGEPLVLVKGPPGTGKTTVIAEAIRAAKARGQKVLVCSETHQAVDNVLERLNEDGRIHMVRHGRVDGEKISDIGKQYLEDGARHGFVRNVATRTTAYAAKIEKEITTLEKLLPMAKEARDASDALAKERLLLEEHDSQARATHRSRCQDIEERCTSFCAETRATAETELSLLRAEERAHETKLKRQIVNSSLSTKKWKAAKNEYARRTGETPGMELPEKASVARKMLSLGINRLASVNHLHEKYVKAIQDHESAEAEINRYKKLLELNRQRQAENSEQQILALTKAEDDASGLTAAATAQMDATLDAIRLEREEAEGRLLPPQTLAASFASQAEGRGPCAADWPCETWDERIRQWQASLRRYQERQAFNRRWLGEIENGNAALPGLFRDTLDVFLSTCVGLASWRLFADTFRREGVDLLIIDEAAHATLTQSMIPMGRARRAVLIGDEMQLPPAAPMSLGCKNACVACSTNGPQQARSDTGGALMSSCWLERSAFEWISNNCPWVPRIMLNKQFRMHPDIADFVSQVFYDGKLVNGVDSADRELAFGPFTKAVCLIPTSAYKDRFESIAPGQSSFCNPLEVKLIKRIMEQASRHVESKTSFGILTPYAAQKTLMQKELAGFFKNSGKVLLQSEDVASVDSFQGSERDVMVASFVRSPKKKITQCSRCRGSGVLDGLPCRDCQGRGYAGANLQWVHDLKRLNVAFSRARKMLILVGDVDALTHAHTSKARGSQVLDLFRRHVADRGRVLHVWEEDDDE